MTTKNLLIFGNSQMAEISNYYFDNFSDYSIAGFVVDEEYISDKLFEGKAVLSTDEVLESNLFLDHDIFIAIGYSELNRSREEKYKFFKNEGFNFATYVSEKATIFSKNIGENCLVLEDNTIQPFSKIGNNCFLWSGNHIGHHSIIKDNCFISSHVVISGNCQIGNNSFIGVNSSIADGVTIGKSSFIGFDVSIIKDLPDNSKVTIKNQEDYL